MMKLWIACFVGDVTQLKSMVNLPEEYSQDETIVTFENVEVSEAEFKKLEGYFGHFVWGPALQPKGNRVI